MNVSPIIYEWIDRMRAEGRGDDAASFLEALEDVKTSRFSYYRAQVLSEMNEPEQAYEIASIGYKNYPLESMDQKFEFLLLLGILSGRTGRIEEATTYLTEALEICPAHQRGKASEHVTKYSLASVLAVSGELEKANEIFADGQVINCGNGWQTSTQIIDFSNPALSLTVDASDALEANSSAVQVDGAELIYLVAADFVYFEKFGEALATHVSKSSGSTKVQIHYHLVEEDWDRKRRLRVKNIKSKINEIHELCTFSTEHLKFESEEEIERKVFYSCARFLALPNVLKGATVPIIVADIDQVPLVDPMGIVSETASVQFLRFDTSASNIFSLFSATLSVFSPKTQALEIAERVKAYLVDFLTEGKNVKWHLDQIAIACVALSAREHGIEFLKSSVVAVDQSEASKADLIEMGYKFWSVTHSIPSNSTKQLEA